MDLRKGPTSRRKGNFDFDILKTLIAVGLKLGTVIVQCLRQTRGDFRAMPTSGVGVATDRANAVRNWPFFPSVPSAAAS